MADVCSSYCANTVLTQNSIHHIVTVKGNHRRNGSPDFCKVMCVLATHIVNSSSWARTSDLAVNSRTL